jgi:signal transduction histidine kinase
MNPGDPSSRVERSLRETLERERTARQICSELNGFVDLEPMLATVLRLIRRLTDCQAVGIRLHDHGDYPYFVYEGFPAQFIRKESSLCSRDADSERMRRADGQGYELDCMCGTIIHGEADLAQPFHTAGGSFWSNGTTALLAETSEEDRGGRTLNYCNACGYESVALIPIRAHGERIGLIQLDDKRTDRFTLDLVEYLEMLGEHVGVAVRSSLIHSRLKSVSEELERSNRDLEQFASVVSHDLQQPLAALVGYADLLASSYPAASDSVEQKYIQGILEGSSRMEEMIRGMLSYSRATREAEATEEVDLALVVGRVVGDLAGEIERTGAAITHDALPTVRGSATLLTQLFQNLVGNAMKFHAKDPPRIHLSSVAEDEHWTFAVRDNGIGVALDDQDDVFRPFHRADGAGGYPGTGLGLAICRKLVNRFGGRIWVVSEPGQGSTFSFTLPR